MAAKVSFRFSIEVGNFENTIIFRLSTREKKVLPWTPTIERTQPQNFVQEKWILGAYQALCLLEKKSPKPKIKLIVRMRNRQYQGLTIGVIVSKSLVASKIDATQLQLLIRNNRKNWRYDVDHSHIMWLSVSILYDHLNMRKLSTRWVLRWLTIDYKRISVTIWKACLALCNNNPDELITPFYSRG